MTATIVEDRFDVVGDPALPFLARALDPGTALAALTEPAGPFAAGRGSAAMLGIRVMRHKPGRRCLIAYTVEHRPRWGRPQTLRLLGKVRAKGLDRHAYEINKRLWHAGFSVRSHDGIAVPRAMGVVPAFHMWLQEAVPGRRAGDVMQSHESRFIGQRVAESLAKLHRCPPVHPRRHTVSDELDILQCRLSALAVRHPELAERLIGVARECDRITADLDEGLVRGIHRDFYQDNVLVDGERIWLVDLDLYSRGQPAIDAGNFSAHLIELALREGMRQRDIENGIAAFERRYLELVKPAVGAGDLNVCTTLALARLVSISSQIPGREQLLHPLLDLCEQRTLSKGRGRPSS
jgi:tRNA A-37 threonylcarbamoyl transferase component Bud32